MPDTLTCVNRFYCSENTRRKVFALTGDETEDQRGSDLAKARALEMGRAEIPSQGFLSPDHYGLLCLCPPPPP